VNISAEDRTSRVCTVTLQQHSRHHYNVTLLR